MDGKPWRIELLGDVRIRYGDGEWIPLSYQKPVGLLLYLATFPQRPHPREVLIEILWPEADPDAGRLSLRTTLHSLRRLLESTGASAESLLLADRTTLRLDPTAFTTDLAEYLTAVSEAERARSSTDRSQALGRAVACYTGEFLPGFTDGWAFGERERLLTTQRELLQRLVRVREELGEGEGALWAAREMVGLDPLWEEAHYEVMRLYAALGQPSACLRQYQELERILREELNETPSAQVRALAEELRQGARSVIVARSAVTPTDFMGEGARGRGGEGATTADGSPHADRPAEAPSHSLAPRPSPLAPSSSSRLPAQLTRFFGREEEIAWITQTLCYPDVRLVTLTGPGGTGKTRLAVTAAGRLIEAWEGAVWFVPLADVVPPPTSEAGGNAPDDGAGTRDRIAATIAEALGLPPAAGESPLLQVVEALARQPALLVLDNFEQLVEEGAPLVSALLESVPSLTCLVTSRQHLDLVGEQEFAVLPLPTPRAPSTQLSAFGSRFSAEGAFAESMLQCASVLLFLDRARAVRPGFQIDQRNSAAVVALCDRLEGLPLALELAAAWVRTLTPAQILERLSQRFELLVGRQRNVAARHQSLRAAIEWSYQLLSSEQRLFFVRLSVFRGRWTLEAAEAVTEEPRALSYLHQLQECSLVVGEETGEAMRYRLLETLREFAAEQVGPEERRELARRHAEFFLELAEKGAARLSDAGQGVWLERLERDRDNLRTALRWSREPAPPEAAESGAAHVPAVSASGRWEIGLRLGTALVGLWLYRGPMKEGREHLEELLASHARSSFPSADGDTGMPPHLQAARGWALAAAGALAVHTNDHEAAHCFFEEGRETARLLGAERLAARCLLGLGEAFSRYGELAAARPRLEEALALYRKLGDRENIALSLGVLGDVARDEGDLDRARVLYEEARAIRRDLADGIGTGWILYRLAHLARIQGNLDRAYVLYEESLAIFREGNASMPVAEVLGIMGHLALALGERETAESLGRAARQELEKTLALAQASGDRRAIADATLALAEMAHRALDLDPAWRYAEEARWQMESLGDRNGLMRAIRLMAFLALSCGDRQSARTRLEELMLFSRQVGDSEVLIHALGAMGHLDRDEGDYARARSWYEESLRVRRKMGNQHALAQSLEDFAVLAGRDGHAERAIRLLGAGEAFCETLGARPPVAEATEYERTVAEGRAALGEAAFTALWAEGRALSLQQAIDYVLGETSGGNEA